MEKDRIKNHRNKSKDTKPESVPNDVTKFRKNGFKMKKKVDAAKELLKSNELPSRKKKYKIISDEEKESNVKKPSKSVQFQENKDSRNSRTLFVGNVPVNFNKKHFLKLVKKYGEIEKMWTRGVKPKSGKVPKKVALIKNLIDEDHPPLVVYLLFQTASDARNALSLNGQLFENHHLRVTSSNEKQYDKNKGVFVGNLPLNVKDEELYDMFSTCGEILGVRIVRDSITGTGKGFGYVNFQSADAVEFALKLNEETLNNREIRVQRLFTEGKKKKMDKRREKLIAMGRKDGSKLMKSQKLMKKGESQIRDENSKKSPKKFQGNPANKKQKKKKKSNPADLKKKIIAKKMAVKPKKAT